MNLILVANEESSQFKAQLDNVKVGKLNFLEVGNYSLFLDEILEVEHSFFVVIIDNYHTYLTTNKYQRIIKIAKLRKLNNPQNKLFIITSDLGLYRKLVVCESLGVECFYETSIISGYSIVNYLASKTIKTSKIISKESENSACRATDYQNTTDSTQKEKATKGFFKRFRSNKSNLEDTSDRSNLSSMGKGVSKSIAITGRRGTGITSTTLNLAKECAINGLSTIIVDLDIRFRSMNMYVESYNEIAKTDIDMNASLIKMLARPGEYMTKSYPIEKNLWLTSLGYDFHDKQLLSKFYTVDYIIGMITTLKTKFNVILIDMPFDVFENFKELRIHVDLFGLCIENNIHSILNTLREVDTTMSVEEAQYFNSKTKLIVNKYVNTNIFNGDFLTAESVSDLLASGISSKVSYKMPVAGLIDYNPEFNTQIEKDIPMVLQSKKVAAEFNQVMLRLIESN